MGLSTNAYLVYGVPIPKWDEQIRIEQQELPKEFWGKDEDPDSEIYIGDLNDDNCEMFSHCHGDCPMWIAKPKSIEHKYAWRGYPVEVHSYELTVSVTDDDNLRKFCEKLGVEYTEPKWWLCSYMG